MKNLICITLALIVVSAYACSITGCGETELIELSERKTASAQDDVNFIEEAGTEETGEVGNQVSLNDEKTAGDDTQNNEKMAESPESDSRPFVVYVCGEVNNPGVYELYDGARIFDAVAAAGGCTDDAYENYLNMATYVCDEQMIYVPSNEEIRRYESEGLSITGSLISGVLSENSTNQNVLNPGGANNRTNNGQSNSNTSSSGNAQTSLVNINTASKEELMTIKGVGESKAEKIIAYREENGGFGKIEDIMNITGIKEGMFNKVKDQICVD